MSHRVAFIIRRASGGMLSHLTGLISKLDRETFHPHVIGPVSQSFETKLRDLGAEFYRVEIADKFDPIKDAISVKNVVSALKKIKPEILHMHGNKAVAVGIPAASLAGIPTEKVITVHNFLSQSGKAKIWGFFLRKADRVVAVSEAIKKEALSTGMDGKKIEVIHNGIDLDNFILPARGSLRSKLSISDEERVIGAMGRVVSWKGFPHLVDALCEVLPENPGWTGLIAGDGPDLEKLKNAVSERGLNGRIVFTGYIDNARDFFSDIDLFVFPSLREPFGIVLLEAMASRKPVIAAASAGTTEIVDESCAVLVEPGKADQISDALRRLISYPETGLDLAELAFDRVRDDFSLDRMAQKTQELYEELIQFG